MGCFPPATHQIEERRVGWGVIVQGCQLPLPCQTRANLHHPAFPGSETDTQDGWKDKFLIWEVENDKKYIIKTHDSTTECYLKTMLSDDERKSQDLNVIKFILYFRCLQLGISHKYIM